MKVLSIVGARPQFIKAAPVDKVLRADGHEHILLHTGQHYDYGMSKVFFDELDIPEPDINLEIGSDSHARQTGKMLIGVEEVIIREMPDWVLVYGDTNSTLAGALAAVKLNHALAHVEAGLRSFNRQMPEEHNRVLTDHCSTLLFCPSQTAVDNLTREGISSGVHLVGDVMYDAVLHIGSVARIQSTILKRLDLTPKSYLVATIHRPYNTDNPQNLHTILEAFNQIDETIIFPVHPRTQKRINEFGLNNHLAEIHNLITIPPVSYLDMLMLEQNARFIVTDSGGMQKEAYFLGVPCLTLRPETEWVETIENGWNRLIELKPNVLRQALERINIPSSRPPVYGEGNASHQIAHILKESK
jgi:UDP-N-acetylglucosamine 2-epimerase